MDDPHKQSPQSSEIKVRVLKYSYLTSHVRSNYRKDIYILRYDKNSTEMHTCTP